MITSHQDPGIMTLEAIKNQGSVLPLVHEQARDDYTAAEPASPLDLPAEVFSAGLERRKANRAVLMDWIRAALVEGVDFGKIHAVGKSKCRWAAAGRVEECPDLKHWSKPILFKPGAEKICGMLGVTVHFPNLHDYEQAMLRGAEIEHIILHCEIRDPRGRVVADGVGARSLDQDTGDLNKALKMAAKGSHVDATLRMAGLSEVFTQDLEVMQEEEMRGGGIAESRLIKALKGYIDTIDNYPRLENWGKRYVGLVNLLSEPGKKVMRAHYKAQKERLESKRETKGDLYATEAFDFDMSSQGPPSHSRAL